MIHLYTASTPTVRSFWDQYQELSQELQRIIGTVEWPAPHEMIDIVGSV